MKKFSFHFHLLEDDDNNSHILHGNITYIIAFLVPVIMLCALYYIRDIYPFGENCYLRSDMYHQYAPFFKELWRKLRTGESLSYSWDIGMGTNFTALYAYYLASPVNWLIALFPEKYIIEVMNGIIIIKSGIASVTLTHYIIKRCRTKTVIAALFGMFYAMSGFMAAYNWNIMWLDCIILFPLIMLGLERLVHEDNCLLYTITLGLCIYTNYYISIMVCITIVLYFIVLMFSYKRKLTVRTLLRKCVQFALYSLLGGGLAAALLLPVMYAFTLSASNGSTFPDTLMKYFSLLDMLARHLMNIPVHLGLDHYPNIYCGVAVFILLPLYVMNKKIRASEKVGKFVLLLFFLLAYNLNIPNFIWHGFHYPNSLPARQSFIYIFFLLTMCFEGVKDLRQLSSRHVTTAFAIGFGLLVLLEDVLPEMYEWKVVYISGAFLVIYGILLFFYYKKRLKMPVLLFFIFAFSIIECTLNMEETGLSTTNRVSYLLDNNAVDNLLTKISADDKSFYRIEKPYGARTKNDAAWHGYRSISTFSSTSPAGITDLLGSFGCEHSMNAYSFQGATLLTASVFNTKYVISNKLLAESELFSFYYGNDGEFLYENHYTLPVGFMVGSDIETSWDTASTLNGIEVQNSFVKATTGIEDLFVPTNEFRTDLEATFTPLYNAHMYAVIRNVNCDTVTVHVNDKMFHYNNLKNNNHIIDIGYVTREDEVTIEGDTSMNTMIYAMNTEKFKQAYTILAQGGFNVTEFTETSMKGTIHAQNDGILFFSIPYDGGWTITVDGKKMKPFSVKDAVLGIQLGAGEHTVELQYHPVNLIPGIMITIASAMILAALAIMKSKFNFLNIIQKTRHTSQIEKEEML